MKKPTILKIALLFLLFLQCDVVSSQNLKPFVRQFDTQLKGDILVIGNNILNRRETRNGQVTTSPNTAYNGTDFNGDFDMRYINIDNGATTGIFSSSSAVLTVPNNRAPASPCYRVAYAALYWSATLKGTNRANIEKVKIKVPNTANSGYQDVTGTIIHDITTSAGGINPDNTQAYACFADITSLLSASNPNGNYTVANVISSEGSNGGTGLSAGWSLFIVYEDSSLPTKAISTFNGFTARAQGGGPNNTIISGFTTIPTGPVQARFAFAALEGDYGYRGDYLQINGATITPPTRPRQSNSDNFFNSSINSLGTSFTNRVPNSTNTLGFDTGVIDIDPSAKIIKNNDTSATITLGTNSDIFIYYFTAFSVDIIAPKVVLKKAVKDINNNDASNKNVVLGEELRYELSFQNEGNDNATSFTIVDQLPVNTTFNFPADLISLPPGMTIPTTSAGNQYVTYNATTRTITFTIPNSYVTAVPTRAPESTIKFRVKVVDDCSKLTDACSNIIKNSAESHYFGQLGSTTTDFGDKSYSTTAGCNLVPQSTNFLVGLDACKNRRQEICTTNMVISASGGYKSYSWSTNPSGTPVIGTNQALTITQPGTYYVYNTANPPCIDLQETITVVDGGGVRTNPVIPYADNKEPDGTIIGCVIDGKPLPKIYLCGTNDSRLINVNVTNGTVVWQKTNCVRPVDLSETCADERAACAWVSAGPDGPTFNANTAGYYRVTINAGGCNNTYYFNVYKSDVSVTVSKKDKLCYKSGNITVQKINGYEYSLTNLSNNTTGGYQDSNSFEIWNAGTYVVNYRLKGIANTCVYKTQQVIINDLNINAKVENPNEQPLCFGSNGSITVSASEGFSSYYFVLYDGATIIDQVGPLTDRVYTFSAAPGKYYEVEVYSVDADGKKDCTARAGKYINNPSSQITPVATTIVPLTACSDGKYRISATGGTGPYSYFVDGSTTAQAYSENDNTEQNNIIIVAPAAKTYSIRVVDSNLCEKTITLTVPGLPKPTYTVSNTNSACYNSGAEIRVTLGAGGANGYTMGYSINNGGSYQTNPVFSNLQPGTYKVIVKYSITYAVPYWPNTETKECIDPAQTIIISGPTSALVASAGVAELAGCTLSQQGGKLRINNAQGGTAPYQYSFDNGATWQASNEKDVLPGQYILKIKDALGCEYTIPYDIILDQKPADPTIKVEDPVFNCNGTATSKVTVTNGTSTNYTYEYYLDGVANTPITNNTFLNVPSGSHTVSVKYNVSTVSTYSNLLQEDFGKGGYTTTPGISPVYCFEDESTPHPASWPTATCGSIGDYQINDGKYAVASSIKTNFGNTWIVAKDHTTPVDALGRFLCVNIGSSAGVGGIIYSKPIKDVIVNQPVIISLWAENLMRSTTTGYADPELTIQLINNLNGVGGPETIVATTDTTNPWRVPKSEKWEYKELSLNPGAYNNLSFVIRSYNIIFSGNDLLVDDIWVRQIPKSCIATKDFPIVIDTNKAFTASITGSKDVKCLGANDGEITISAQNFKLPYGFDYSLDNGATWINSKVSPVTATGLISKTYSIQVRYDASASSCVIPLTQVVKSPTAVTITATVTKLPTCTTGATITAVGAGGTPAYQYELRQSNGTTVVTAFQASGVFTNVPAGTYTVVTRDSNACSSPASAVVTVNSSTAPTASLAASSDLCYDTVNQSTLVVTATGTGSLTYSLDGQPAQTSNTFTNVGPGTHNIVVTDSNSCTAAISNIVIAPELKGTAVISKTLDCTLSTPDATITVNIAGGNSAFTYKVKKGAGAYGSSNPVTGTSFVYSATTADTYSFEITDAKGCTNIVTAIVNPIVNPTVTATKVDATCSGASTGSVQLVGAGGSGGYTYLFYNNTTLPVPTAFVAQSNYTGLAAGTYSYQGMDSKGCKSAVATITIAQPTTLTATATATTFTCNASNIKQAATVTIAVPTTGTAPYEYSFDGGTTFTSTRTLSVTDNGTNQTISYVVKDAQGCKTGVQTITINRLNPPTDITFTAAAVTCTATTTTVTALATNGVGTITYSITSPAASVASNTTGVFAGLAPGTYNFRATDANGCYFNKPFIINAVTPISVVANKDSDVLCKGGSTGKVTFTVSGIATAGAYTYTLTPATGTITKAGNILTLINVAAGSYSLQVTDTATGCTNTATIIINEPTNALTVTAVPTNISCNNGIAQITVTPNGGTPNYTYAVVIAGATAPTVFANGNVLSVDTNSGANLNWDVYVKDANGCITPRLVTIAKDNLPTVTATNSNQCAGTGSTFVITATGTGKAPLTYSIDGTSFQTSNVFNVPAGTYTVTVKDGNGCTATAVTPLIIYPQLVALASVTKELDCTVTPNATITVAVSGGKAQFTYTVKKGSGATSAPSAPFSGTSFTYAVTAANADTYTFVVTDANGCASTTTTTVNTISSPTVTETHINPSCDGGANGSVVLVGAGGSGGYTYSNNGTTYTANATFTGLAAGTYTFYVKDSKNCATPITVTLTAPTQLAATVTEVPFSCNAANGKVAGTITVNVTAGTGTLPYQYSFNGGGFGNSNTLTLNDNGANQPYTYSVRDGLGCTISGSGTLLRLNPPTDLTFAAAAVTCTATTTTVTLTAINGVGALQYETIAPSPVIIAKQTSNSFANLAPGTYMFKVTDANGCFYTEAHTINPVTPITLIGTKISDVLCNAGNTGAVRFNVAGFATTYSYTVNGGTAVTAQTASAINLTTLVAGTYTVIVTDNATGCTATAAVTINQPAALAATYTTINGNCSVSTSNVTVTVTGGSPVYRYSFVQNNAAIGTYSNSNTANLDAAVNTSWDVHIIDANGCTFKLDITIAKDVVPTVTASATGQCFGVGSYTITATPGTGLVAPLAYSIDNGASYQTGNTFVITTPGSYTVKIKDGNGCTADSNVVIVDNVLTLNAVLDKNITCSLPTAAQITLTAGGGSTPYTYESKEAAGAYTAMASNVFNTMTPGSYTFRVTDAKGCRIETTTPILITPTVNPDITNVVQTALINCNGDDTAAIAITIDNTKGLAPFVYTVRNTTTGVNYGTQTSGLAAGSYVVTVTDAKGCTDTFNINIAEPTAIIVAHHAVPITCNGAGVSKGSVIVDSVVGGVGPYNYFVTGVNGYDASEPNNLGTTSVSFNVVDFGLYQINVVDSNGCSVLIQNVLVASPPDDLDITVISPPANCSTGGSAVVAIGTSTTIIGSGPFYFAVYTGTIPVYPAGTWLPEDAVGSKKATFTNLLPGVTYTFIVYDADAAHGGTGTGCYYYETATTPIPTNSTLTTNALIASNITCKGSADGKVTFTIASTYPTATPISYEIFNSQSLLTTGVAGTGSIPANGILTLPNIGPLPFGNYFVLVKETAGATNAGCSVATVPFNITESAIDLSVTASVSKNANCNAASGVITILGKDGTVDSTNPYTYQLLLASATAPTAGTPGWTVNNTFNRDAGSYIAYVKDKYGCIKQVAITLNKDADPTITAPATICYDGTPFTITIGGTVDPAIVGGATYSVNGSTFQTSPNFTFNAAGIYNLTIKDGNGCTATVAYEVKPQLFLSAKLTKELDCTGTPNAQITLTATGGYNTAYTYAYSTDGGGSFTTMPTNVLSTSVLGNYIFRVRDAKLPIACEATTTFTLDPVQPTIFTTVQTHVSCNGGTDGTITVNVTSGVGPYQYQLNGGTFQTSNVFTGLTAGTAYIITVRDAKSCLYSNPAITITQPTALTATSAITTALTCTTGNAPTKAVVTVTASQGTAPYLYSFDGTNYSTVNTYESFVGVTLNVLVKDAKGCIFTLTNGVNIPVLNPPTITTITGTPIYCAPAANTTSTVTITTTNGVGALSYVILSPASATTNVTGATSGIFTGLADGTYLFEVTDANGCKDQESYTVKPVTNITIAGELVSNVTCNGGNNGAVKFTAANYAGSYTAVLIAGTGTLTQTGNTVNVTGLVPGTYTVQITDGITGCTATASITVTQPTAVALGLVSNTNANCNFGARVTVSATGGTPAYKYAFVVSGATPVAADYDTVASVVLDPATSTAWDAYVLDANNCPAVYSFTIATDALPTIDNPAAPYCYMGGPVPVTITGTYVGVPMYSIGNNYQSSPDFVLNAPGTYTFSIRDGNGCVTSVPYTLNQQLLLKATLTQDYTCAGDASITLLATQGTLTYNTFEVSYNNGAYTAVNVQPYTTNIPGTYTFRVTDSQGCQAASVSVEVTPRTTPTATATQNNVSCTGGSDGSIIVTAANGVLPYQYQLDGGAFVTSNIFTGLAAGLHNIVVKDAKECITITLPVTITEPTALAATATVTTPLTCGTGNSAQAATVTVTVDPTTGTAPYQYSFNGGTSYGTVNTYTTTVSGLVSALVKDANNCVIAVPATVTVQPLDPPTITTITGTPIYCAPIANTTSTVTITTTNGVGALSYVILSPASATTNVTGATTGVFTGLADATYLFEVTDANGCKDQESYIVKPVTNITIAGELVSNVTCNGNADGAVKFTAANYAGTYTAVLTAGTGTLTQTGNTVNVTGLVPGTYTVQITDGITGCTATASITVTQPTAVALGLVSNTNANCNFGARVTVSATGGTPAYKYAFVQSGATPVAGDYDTVSSVVLDPTVNTAWDAYVLDANNCPAVYSFTIGTDALPTIDNPAAPYCYMGGPVPVTITGTYVGVPMYSIGNNYQSSPDFVLNAPGTYTFSIRDGNGCVTSKPYTLNQQLLLKATLTQDYTCAGDASITLLATQGTLTYNTFEVSYNNGVYTAVTVQPYTTNIPGTYTFRVTDSQGCQAASVSVEVTPRTTPTATATQNNVSCTGGSDGSIIVTAANGVLPYQYQLDGGAFVTSNIFTGLAAGAHNVVVKDAKECITITLPVTITEPKALAATATVTTPLTCGTGNSTQAATVTIVVDPTTGTAPYQYSFNGGGYGSANTYTTTASGNITVSVRDANLCIIAVPASVTVQPLDPPTIDNVAATPIWCTPAANTTSTVTLTVSHGVGTLAYVITSPASATTNVSGATNGIFTGLPAGTYIFKVTDANGCTAQATKTVDALINITTAGQLINDVVCNGEANGSVKFDVDNFAGSYTAVLTPATGTLTKVGKVVTVTNLPVGNYTILVTDDITGCTATTSVTVGQPNALSLTVTKNTHANCKTGAEVTVVAAGGTPDYKYAFILNTATVTAADYTNSNNAVLDPALGLNWVAYVIDSKGCNTSTPITIVLDPLPNNITTNVATQQCPSATGEYTFTVTVGNGVGPYEYSIGNGFQTSNTFTVNAPGNYTVIVKDANQCEVTVAAPVTILPALKLDHTITALPGCVVTNNGIITATASGGSASANYRYTLDGGVIVTTTPAVFSNVTPGTHIIRVRDIVTTCFVEIKVDIAPATKIEGLHLDPIHVTCNGGSNGSITATIDETGVNDNPVYVYRLTGTTALGVPVNRPNQTDSTFENLQAGDYTVTVTSGRGCQDSEDIRINQFDLIAVSAPVLVQYGCTAGTNTSNYATVTVGTVTGGSGTYTNYEFFRDGVSVQIGPQMLYTETDYLGGSYTVKVTDDASCSGTSTAVPVRPFISIDAIDVAKVAITCISNEDITITVTSTGGTPALLNYTVTGTDNGYNQTKTNGNFTGLTVGSYIITVTNPATGCSLQKAYYVAEPNTFEIKAIPFTKEICFGTTNGSVDLTFVDNQLDPANDAGPFNYTITGPAPSTATITGTTTDAGPLRISNLAAGQYSVVARLVASPTCTVNTVFSIDQPATALTLKTEKDEITCKTGNNDGVIYASAQGGWDTSYEYQLVLNTTTIISDYSATAVFTNLGAGTYTVNVRDSKGCPISEQVILAIPTPIAFTATADNLVLSCFGDQSGVIRVSPPTGGQGSNYLYTLTVLSNNPVTTVGPQASPVFDGLGIGRYTVTVTDAFSCTATSSAEIVITEPTLVKATLAVTRQQTCLTLSQLTLTATGGTGPYTYSATADFAIVLGTFATTTTFDVPVGSYSYYVRDVNGCNAFVTDIRTIDPLVPLDLNIDVSGAVVRCQGDASASIFAEAIGGLGDYVYTLLGATNNVVRAAQTNGTFENLPIGTYYVKVDSHDCTYTSAAIVIDEPAAPVTVVSKVTDVTCYGANNGIIEITATGGTGNIQYAISPDLDKFDSKFIFDKLAPGDYQVVVKDENLCGGIYNFTIANGNILYAALDETSIQPELCAGENNASFRVDIFGGKPGYFVSIDNETAFVPANGTDGTYHIFSGLKGGKHTVHFTDSYGCGPFDLDVITPESVTIDPSTTETEYGCETNTTTVIFDKSNDVADLDFSLDNTGVINPDGPVFKDLTPGPHSILVRHTNGCEKRTDVFVIEGFAELTLTDITVSSKAEVNIIRVQAAGGKKTYLYSFNGGPFTESNEYRIYESGIYKVVVRDQNGCEATIDVEGKFIDFCLPNYFTPNGSNNGHTEIGPGCGALAYKNLTFDIFDRYGRVVAKYHVGQKWDGKYNGEELPTGDYWYVLKLNDEKDDREFVGHFTLYR